MLIAAAVLTILTGIAHSYLGERYILTRLFRRPLPKLFGDDTFTKQTLRFAWHVTTVAWWGFAAVLLTGADSAALSLQILAVTAVVSSVVALIGSRGRHLSWVVFLAVAVLTWRASLNAPGAEQPNAVQPSTGHLEAEVDQIFAAFDHADTPGYVVGIIQDQDLRLARGYGSANLDYRTPITSQSVFNVASLSKQFTATALGLLIIEGKVGLDDPVRLHIPEFPLRFGDVQVKHLVYMTSGIPEYYRQERPGGKSWGPDYFTVGDAIAASLSQSRLDFEPGSSWAYSNVNYMLITEIVARASGMTFAEFARARIFEPLAMSSTHVNDDISLVVPNRVTGYNHREGGGFHQHPRTSPHYGGSGVLTTLEDLARWDRSFSTHALGGTQLTDLLLSTEQFDHDKANDAFGLVWGEFQGHRTLWYEGGDSGFSSYMVRLPDDAISVIVLSNLGTGQAARKAQQVLQVILEKQ